MSQRLTTAFCLLLPISVAAFPLSIEEAEEIALSKNPLYLVSEEEVYQSRERKWQAVSNWLPKLTYESFYAYTFEPTLVEDIASAQFSYKQNLNMNKFALQQPLFSSELLFDVASANIALDAAHEEQALEENRLILAIRKQYYAAVLAALRVTIEKENVAYFEEAFAIEQKRYEGLDAPALTLAQSAVASSNALSLYYKSLQQWESAKNALVQSLGIDIEVADDLLLEETDLPILSIPLLRKKIAKAQETFSTTEVPLVEKIRITEKKDHLSLFSEEEVLAYTEIALSELPELRLKQLAIDLRESALKKTYGEYLPEISTFVDYQKNAGDPASRLFSHDNFSWAAGIKLSWNLFDSFGRERKIREAHSKKVAARLQHRYAVLQTKVAIRDTLFQIEEAIYEHLHAENGVFLGDFAAEQAKEQLQIGTIRPLDYRNAINERSQAKKLRNASAYRLIATYYHLEYLLKNGRNDR